MIRITITKNSWNMTKQLIIGYNNNIKLEIKIVYLINVGTLLII